MTAYYNEIDPHAAQWLRNLIAAGVIAPGVVDERDIADVCPNELVRYTQCHFFAGIGIWSGALRAAGWPDDRPVWTGSCPCQPFSAAGKGAGFADERHVWPFWFHLLTQCRPSIVFGEQVAGRDGRTWLDLVSSDMENADYAFGASNLPAAGVGAPNKRERLYWVARSMADTARRELERRGPSKKARRVQFADAGDIGEVVNADRQGWNPRRQATQGLGHGHSSRSDGNFCSVDNAIRIGRRARRDYDAEYDGQQPDAAGANNRHPWPDAVKGFWSGADWLYCTDERWRPVEEGTFPMVDGDTGRVGALRAYGNGLNFEAATAFVRAGMMALD